MKVFIRNNNEKIKLKYCRSYLELDEVLSNFSSKEEIKERLDLDEGNDIFVEDNNDKPILYDEKIVKQTLSFYKQGKGKDFVDWIYEASSKDKYGKVNGKRLQTYFTLKLDDINTEIRKNGSNPEFTRLKKTIERIINQLQFYDNSPIMLDMFKDKIIPYVEEYVKKNGEYNYAYMRQFIISLVYAHNYKLDDPKIELIETTESTKNKVLEDFKIQIHNHYYPNKQVTIDDLMSKKNTETKPLFDENGIKIDEKEFLEEFNTKKLSL